MLGFFGLISHKNSAKKICSKQAIGTCLYGVDWVSHVSQTQAGYRENGMHRENIWAEDVKSEFFLKFESSQLFYFQILCC